MYEPTENTGETIASMMDDDSCREAYEMERAERDYEHHLDVSCGYF